ncbi:MAG: NAD(P)/FAD-dependent oxidoreductase [Candidatus Palauibacterales bacterium]|nr:NAD(P)/FAD-dependent oxidoreductase [Candidatus Palauibacterales bacterium]
MSRLPRPSDGRPVLVVVGAGFAGLELCKRFRGDGHVILIDRQNHHLFQPLLYQVAMAGLSAPDIAAPIRSVLARRRRVSTHMATVEAVDLEARTVTTPDITIEWDWLVLAVGGVTGYFGRDEWSVHALGLKTLDDALRIRSHILNSFERAENELDPAEKSRLTTIVVVGGGPTGVELAGAMAELAHRVFRRDFRHIDPARSRIVLVEATDRILGAFTPGLSESGRRQLEDLGVEVRLESRVLDVRDDGVRIAGPLGVETIETRNVLWGAGVTGHPLLRSVSPALDLDLTGRARVEPDLSVRGHPRAFVIGDAAALEIDGEPVPGLAPAAIQMGRYVARVVRRELKEGPKPDRRPPFRYTDKGIMATIGRRRAIAMAGPIRATGFVAWLMWLFVHLMTLVGFRNRVFVFFEWMWQYLTYQRGARIITRPENGTEGRKQK